MEYLISHFTLNISKILLSLCQQDTINLPCPINIKFFFTSDVFNTLNWMHTKSSHKSKLHLASSRTSEIWRIEMGDALLETEFHCMKYRTNWYLTLNSSCWIHMIFKKWARFLEHIEKFQEIIIIWTTHHGRGREVLDQLNNTQNQ